ncbi:beta-1,3-galactosyltransferase 5-like isoform X2 [Daphnia carinata]|uniref:beta-1,3-galactosyltransferase 5-like isoform X2 n=1 Tax=Daphnia carinata TaxID=120202 RepID=UPI00257DF094|nr:beta-1,3-galactosyltransferase 5-like isoform X2 [Daphnia carinata]
MLKRSVKKWVSSGVWFIIILILFFFLVGRFEHQPKLTRLEAKHSDILRKSSLIGYTNYTIERLGLKPIPFVSPLEPNSKEQVINDVLSFVYPIDINLNGKFKCRHWDARSTNTEDYNKTLLIVVISAAEHSAKRDLIRRTWASPSVLNVDWIQVIFLVGSTRDENKVTTEQLKKENAQHEDLVQVNVVDTYANLTLKSVAMLHWTHSHCPGAELVLKCDDDNYINWNVFMKILPAINATRSIYGTPVPTLFAERWKSQKHYVSRLVWPWPRYPSYLMGGCYAISGQSITPLLGATQTTPFFWIEDIYLTGLCASKANILPSRYPRERSIKFLLCAEDSYLADPVFKTIGNIPQSYQ